METRTTECEHGEPRGPSACALCRRGFIKAKELGQDRAIATKAEWAETAYEALRKLALTGRPFTADDLIAEVGLPTGAVSDKKNNAVGALFTKVAKTGLITRIGYTTSSRKSGHATTIGVWRGFYAPKEQEEQGYLL